MMRLAPHLVFERAAVELWKPRSQSVETLIGQAWKQRQQMHTSMMSSKLDLQSIHASTLRVLKKAGKDASSTLSSHGIQLPFR
eukprot:6462605-Amphidinium_carterae.1